MACWPEVGISTLAQIERNFKMYAEGFKLESISLNEDQDHNLKREINDFI